MRQLLLLSVLFTQAAHPTSIPIVNPSGEINNGIDRTLVSDPSVKGWDSDLGQVIGDRTDYGNGKWRLSFEDSAEIRQMTSHVVETGASYSLRFDAAMFANATPSGVVTLIGPGIRNGDFSADPSTADSRTFGETPDWFNLGGNQNTQATRTTLPDGIEGRNAVLNQAGTRIFGNETGHLLSSGDRLRATFRWRDANGWNDATDRVRVTIFTTANNTLSGNPTVIESIDSALSTVNSAYQTEQIDFAPISATSAEKQLFVSFEGLDGNGDGAGFGRLDNFRLELIRGNDGGNPTDPGTRLFIADLYIDDNGTPLPIATQTYPFKSPVVARWDHYHLAVPPGALDAHAGKTLGVRFRSDDSAEGNFQSIDNVRLDFWPQNAPDGSFLTHWNDLPNQTWAGPGYWANRLQDWRVNNNRVECINGNRERLTLHRPGTSIRGNGTDFSLSVRTGLHTGSHSAGSRAGFLLGGAPNVDWRGALLVHDSLGRDFGLFLGLTGNGNLVLEDYSTGAVTALASQSIGSFGQNTRLELNATANLPAGTQTLTLTAFHPSGAALGSLRVEVPSDRVLGAFGLLSHYGTSAATHWFDDFRGTGAALNPEPERHLAILGAMHTLSRGTLKLTAQLSPIDLSENPLVFLDVREGGSWVPLASARIDNTDNLSSYTATFSIPDWNDEVDTDYRLRVNLGDTDYEWTGTIRRDPVDQEEVVIAMTTCQRINDNNLQNNGFDWSPVMLWQPHELTYRHLAKHHPDVFLAHGDQIYEGQPTRPDKSSARNRQLDYLYKWNLWVLQSRELTRKIPTIAIPDDHDVFQGNLWGEGGIATANQNSGGYTEPASWVRLVERTQTSHLPDPDPYNAMQPPPTVAQGIKVYFTGVTYGRLGFAVLEDRKFKTGSSSPPANLDQQHLLGERQYEFLRNWNEDWRGQDLKLVVSQSPMATLRTHASSGYNYGLNDRDSHGWPVHRRNEAWRLWRKSRMFQLAGDQHLATLTHHGADAPRDAGISFTAPAVANFFPRIFDPVNHSRGTTSTVSPFVGDYFFDGNGTLPDGITPNRTANDPHHFAMLAAGNSQEYYQTTRGINPANLHDRGAGYGITRVNRRTREITFECWPVHVDPDEPSTGTQFPGWPQTFRQNDNDGRTPIGYLPLIDTQWRIAPVIRVFDEATNELVHAMRIRGTRYRPPVFNNNTTYRVEIAYDDETVSETRTAQTANVPGEASIRLFRSVNPSIIAGNRSILEWDVSAAATLTIDQGVGDAFRATVDGIGYLEVSPITDTTYTLTLNGDLTAQTTVRVFANRESWNTANFTRAELANPMISGGESDPDGDGFRNDEEFQFQTDPRNAGQSPGLIGSIKRINGILQIDFNCPVPLNPGSAGLIVESSPGLGERWTPLPSNSYRESSRENFPATGTSRITVNLNEPLPPTQRRQFFRARWKFNP
jgi:hypothetical protein